MIAGSALAQVRNGETPTTWPSDDAFDFGLDNGERTLGYEYGWAACQMIAEKYGEDSLVPFYRAVVTASGSPTDRVDRASQKVLGVAGPILLDGYATVTSGRATTRAGS